jgi:ABC-type transport system involved in multi-copper enzyme maturation permease subunit
VSLLSLPIARATFQERGKRSATIGLVLIVAVLGLFHGGQWAAEAFSGISTFWVFLLTLTLGGGLLADEVESGHAQLTLLRPITRAQWVSGRLLGACAVLCAGLGVAWIPSFIAALSRGQGSEALGRIFVLPLALLPQLGWLATLAALSAFLRSWMNAALLILARMSWVIGAIFVPLRFPEIQPFVKAVTPFVGPQEALELAQQVHFGDHAIFSPALWDVFWFFAAWTVAVVLFEKKELARRRA